VQIGDNRAAEWVRRSNPVALGLLFSGLAGQQQPKALTGRCMPQRDIKVVLLIYIFLNI
jgi:hypothetical protein